MLNSIPHIVPKGNQYYSKPTQQAMQGRYSGYETNYIENNDISIDKILKPDDQSEKSYKNLLVYILLNAAMTGVSSALSNALMKGKEFAPSSDVKKIAEKMVKDNKLDINIQYLNKKNLTSTIDKYPNLNEGLVSVYRGENAFFFAGPNGKNLAVAPEKKPSLILHELGHAINNTKKGWKFMQNTRAHMNKYMMGFFVLSMISDKIGRIKDDIVEKARKRLKPANNYLYNQQNAKPKKNENFITRNARAIGFLLFVPTILEEACASYRGVSAAKNYFKNNTKVLRPLQRNYLLALGTYICAGIINGSAMKEFLK